MITFKNIDIDVYAYLMWRKDVEGHESIENIHKKLNYNFSKMLEYEISENVKNTILYKYIFFEMKNYEIRYTYVIHVYLMTMEY